ncbi:homoserine O-acetyltransferase MetA [Prolixibacter denitrificans]|uniref:Homoserine O-acetyltransferase n=1 Tax=Prolixibacter denitrificans TaxID=1541063 RepID=A0A2P8CAQ0_9BACT|nr:homoserine O-succinyltransferase [Prolixibacter denitrificans]PSK82002.1 homoserine O-succinyltransferase [Prolixibacter denitrificans]GET22599.1 homoserine O-succinyltransferase [Prolixibacter denitrificans]
MPLNLPDKLPAIKMLKKENIFVMSKSRAAHQDIRPLRIAIVNLMPLKVNTETDLIRLLSNTPLQVEIDLLQLGGHTPKHTPAEHMQAFYQRFDAVSQNNYDGMIITGAPVELLPFEEVDYWNELKAVMDWSVHHVTSTLFICWGAQAGLYHFYGVPKHPLEKKMFGVFEHTMTSNKLPIFRGFDDIFYVPHSRHTETRREDIEKIPDLKIVSSSKESGVYMVMARKGKQIFVTGHSEYARINLDLEYKRDLAKNLPIEVPKNYYPNDDSSKKPLMLWRAHSNLLFSNWLNYYVYQETPFNLKDIK